MHRSGVAYLPLHSGKTPRWLFERMVKLSGAIAEIIIDEYGRKEFIKRLSNPFWFQSFSCVIGFDWHSSGTTTTTCGALKIALQENELGIRIAGGKGKNARRVEEEILTSSLSLSEKNIERLKYASRMAAKVDTACLQDGYMLYHHVIIFDESGNWAVIQQGMKEDYARRYHWFSEKVSSFVEEPHCGIIGDRFEGNVLDMTSRENEEIRKASVDIVKDNPARLMKYLPQKTLVSFLPAIRMPAHHEIRISDLSKDTLEFLKRAYEFQPKDYEELISLKGCGPAKVRALALLSQILFGEEIKWKDPLKYTFAHGGKDGHPYPIDRKTYDESIEFLKDAIRQAKLNEFEKLNALKRLEKLLSC
jgi:hypothetical protein